ncbi:hypothetical protein [Pararhizobium arenae]|uniref:hypothetical protein n=1 Tax=Pararhizobium arenae TaxID=1856850 RepID=UPI00117B1CCB|nr:hypothetical protein [Pararhizobium arenae]
MKQRGHHLPGSENSCEIFMSSPISTNGFQMGGPSIFLASKLFEAMTSMFSTYAYLSCRDGFAETMPQAGRQDVPAHCCTSSVSGTFHIRAAAFSVLAVGALLVFFG